MKAMATMEATIRKKVCPSKRPKALPLFLIWVKRTGQSGQISPMSSRARVTNLVT